ncbi:MAG: DUF4364 family protein [Clostridiales bacterium]|nr:DUF4364 family protein [Clostridiales bacterium]
MPTFTHGPAKVKLFILYTLQTLSADAPAERVLDALFYTDLVSVFDFSIALSNLEEEGLVAAIPRPFGQSYRLTHEGAQTLALFAESLPASERARVEAYICENRDDIRRQTQILTSQRELPGGDIELNLRAAEGARVVLGLTFSVPSPELAKLVRGNWEERNADVYAAIWDILTDAPQIVI